MKKNPSRGLSLLELLIASALSLLIMTGLIRIYLAVKTNNNQQQVWMDLQDAGRFAANILSQRLRLAGFNGCVNNVHPVDQQQAIIGYDSNHLPSVLKNQVVPGTDAVVVKSCVSHSQISQNAELVEMAYYIGDTQRTNRQGQPILALFQKPLDGDREELVAGVEQMQLRYGVVMQPPKDILNYYSAVQIADWQTVRGVQIDLLLNSIEVVLTKPQPYYFFGQTMAPADLLLHKAWSFYVSLRERAGNG